MATEENNGSTEETSGQEQQGEQQQAPQGEAPKGEQQQGATPVIDKSTKLPEDHPLVTAHSTVKEKLAKATTDLAEARAQAGKASKLEEELAKRPTPEALETLQTRYDRLEAFLQAAGGPLSKALDSRSFTRSLFETDDDIKDIVKAWQAANPSTTAEALGSGGAAPGAPKKSMNDLLRAAAKG